jgi:protein-S-isoprenylcysteine O-methyltransferase Ste14
MAIYSLIGISWLVFVVYWFVSSFSAKRSVRRNWGFLAFRIAIAIILIALIDSKTFGNSGIVYSNPNPLVGGIGVVLCMAGIAFAIWARVHIGKNWGMPMTKRVEPELVTSGPYTYVRHPIYTGILLAMFGTTLTLGVWWLIVFVLVGIYFVYSATQEEKFLTEQFPNQYPEYKKRTKMIIPFIL